MEIKVFKLKLLNMNEEEEEQKMKCEKCKQKRGKLLVIESNGWEDSLVLCDDCINDFLDYIQKWKETPRK